MKKLKGVKGPVKLLNVKASNNPRVRFGNRDRTVQLRPSVA